MLFRSTLLALALVWLAGCGDGTTTTQVSGTIKLDGQPIEQGAITFMAADGSTPTSGGEVKDGAYSARVHAGLMRVSISSAKVVGKKKIYPTPNSPEMPITVEAVPAKYNTQTTLTLEVKGSKLAQDYDLVSK
jgi:hypothetical protein